MTAPRLEDAFIALLRAQHPLTATQAIPYFSLLLIQIAVKPTVFDFFAEHYKTTTFRMLCGLLPVSNGQLSVAGVDLSKAAAKARARIGYMSQKFSLYEHLSVLQNLNFFSSIISRRSQYSASSIKCVVTKTVTPLAASWLVRFQNSRLASGSTPEVGSSRNKISGSCINAQAIARRA
jgi:ABC-type ATPase involved in cell division